MEFRFRIWNQDLLVILLPVAQPLVPLVLSLWFRVPRFRVPGARIRVQGSDSRVQGSESRV